MVGHGGLFESVVYRALRYDSFLCLPHVLTELVWMIDDNGISCIWEAVYPKDRLFEARRLVKATKALLEAKGYDSDAYKRKWQRISSQLRDERWEKEKVSSCLPPNRSS
jgi:hypothetical protein